MTFKTVFVPTQWCNIISYYYKAWFTLAIFCSNIAEQCNHWRQYCCQKLLKHLHFIRVSTAISNPQNWRLIIFENCDLLQNKNKLFQIWMILRKFYLSTTTKLFNKQKVELDKMWENCFFFISKVFLSLYLDKIIVKFLSNAISIGIFLSRDIVALGNMRASKLHCSAILPKNIACVNQP